MIRDVIADFVDRKDELAVFRRMLAGESDKRILLVMEPGEKGKSYFIQRLFYECGPQQAPVAILDFDQSRSGWNDYLGVAREVRRYLGDDCAPAICACEDNIFRPKPLVNVQTGDGDGGVEFGRRNRFDAADVSEVGGRDNIKVEVGAVVAGPPSPNVAARHRAEMGRALRDDLARLGREGQRAVLLVDTFEQAREDTCAWLERWVLDSLPRELAHVVLVVGGRPRCQSFFAQARPWSHLVARVRFGQMDDADIENHYRRRGIVVGEDELPGLLRLARLGPARMAEVGDLLEQSKGGAR